MISARFRRAAISMRSALAIDGRDMRHIVPNRGYEVRLLILGMAAIAYLAAFALSLTSATNRLSQSWEAALESSATIRLTGSEAETRRQIDALTLIVQSTPGLSGLREIAKEEQAALLEPWFGPELALTLLPQPRLIEILQDGSGRFDPIAFQLRLSGELPDAIYDDHSLAARSLMKSVTGLRSVATTAVVLVGLVMSLLVFFTVSAAIYANTRTIHVLRLIGARDQDISAAFVARIVMRSAGGALIGTAALAVSLVFLQLNREGQPLKIGFEGASWALLLLVPVLAFVVSFVAAKLAARYVLKHLE